MTDTWTPTPGEEVVVFRLVRNARGTANITETTVDRIGKRDVVLANGDRFPLARLRRSNGTWEEPTYLLQASDARVEQARLANRLSNRLNKIHAAYEAFRREPSDDTAEMLERHLDGFRVIEGGLL